MAMAAETCWLERSDGARIPLPVERWRATPAPSDEMMLAHCSGPTLDIGCGPGRLAGSLAKRGVPVLGVDISPVAIRMTLARGAVAVRRSVFDRLPGEGRWHTVLLADGNIGIGGDPVTLLRRIRDLLSPQGKAIVEVDPPGVPVHHHRVRLNGTGTWFPWAWLGADGVEQTAQAAGLDRRWTASSGDRWFTELVPA